MVICQIPKYSVPQIHLHAPQKQPESIHHHCLFFFYITLRLSNCVITNSFYFGGPFLLTQSIPLGQRNGLFARRNRTELPKQHGVTLGQIL